MAFPAHSLSDFYTGYSIPGAGATPETFDKLRRRAITYETDWDQWLDKLTGELEQEERYFDEIKYREGVRNQLYYEGSFFWRFSEETGQIRDLPHTDVDPFFPHNWFRYFTDLSVAAAMEVSPDIIIDPTRNDDHNIYAAKKARELANYLEHEIITEQFRLETEKTRQLYGGVWWYSYWSMDAGRLFAKRPQFQSRTTRTGGDAFICKCGEAGPVERLQPTAAGNVCPGCLRRTQMQIISAPEVEIQEIVGIKEIPVGFPCTEVVSPLQMKGDRRGHYMQGQYLRRKRLVDRDVIAKTLPWWEPTYGGYGADDQGIRSEEMARRPFMANVSNVSIATFGTNNRERNDVVVEQWWLQPAKYEHVCFNKDVEFIGGENTFIPAGTRLGEVFPEGLYACKVGNEWVDHRPENFRKKWVYIPYIYIPNKSDGDSLKDMCEPQREIIHMRSLLYLYLLARSGGAPTVIKSPLSETAFDGSPQTITRLGAGYTGDLRELFFQPQFPPADPSLVNYVNLMTGEMQVFSQTVSPNQTGDPAAMQMGGTDTARGMMIMNSKAQGLQGPKLMPVAFGQAQAVLQWIELFRENVPDEVPIPLEGKTGIPEWRIICGSDLEGDFMTYPRPGSWIPRPKEEQQAALQNAFAVFGQIILSPDAPRELKRKIVEVYNLDLDLDNYDMEAREAMLKIDQMEQYIPYALQMAVQMEMAGLIPPDEQTGEPSNPIEVVGQLLAQMCPPDQDLDDAQVSTVYVEYFKGWLRGDEGKRADPILQSGVRNLLRAYGQIIQQEQQAQQEQMMQMQSAPEQAKQQGAQQLEQAKHQNKMQEIDAKHGQTMQKQQHSMDNQLQHKIAEKALDAALATGNELPSGGHETVPRLSDLPAQPAF